MTGTGIISARTLLALCGCEDVAGCCCQAFSYAIVVVSHSSSSNSNSSNMKNKLCVCDVPGSQTRALPSQQRATKTWGKCEKFHFHVTQLNFHSNCFFLGQNQILCVFCHRLTLTSSAALFHFESAEPPSGKSTTPPPIFLPIFRTHTHTRICGRAFCIFGLSSQINCLRICS